VRVEPLERLEAIEEIKRLKARYFRCMDTKDWAGFAEVFTPEAVLDVSGETGDDGGVIRGRAEIVTFVRGVVDAVETAHHGHMPEIEVTSSTTASGIWAMEDTLRWPEGGPIRALRGFGHYHESYERVDGQWFIASTTLTRLRVDTDTA
jgi:SnoaL-like domain